MKGVIRALEEEEHHLMRSFEGWSVWRIVKLRLLCESSSEGHLKPARVLTACFAQLSRAYPALDPHHGQLRGSSTDCCSIAFEFLVPRHPACDEL